MVWMHGSRLQTCSEAASQGSTLCMQRKLDLCSVELEEQAQGAAHAAQAQAHLEWAQRTGYCAGEAP